MNSSTPNVPCRHCGGTGCEPVGFAMGAEEAALPLLSSAGIIVGWTRLDAADAPRMSQYVWRLANPGYAHATVARNQQAFMHRMLMGLTPGDGFEADHINRDKIDNRRSNLRVLTNAQNNQNRDGRGGGDSRYRGVRYRPEQNAWGAHVRLPGEHYSMRIGQFATEIQAAQAAARFRAVHVPFTVEDPALLGGSHLEIPRVDKVRRRARWQDFA